MMSRIRISGRFFTLYNQAISKTIREADIMLSTTVSTVKINEHQLKDNYFLPDIGILDEAAQAFWYDPICFLNMGVKKLVLVGDERQLTPTVISQN
jgi:superfamily I DNA and/or RNA helicase